MTRLRFSQSARRDLIELFDYLAKDNPVAARIVLAKLRETCRRIARFPMMGIRRDDLAPEVRSFPVANYVVFYRSVERGTEIVRVLRAARDHLAIMD